MKNLKSKYKGLVFQTEEGYIHWLNRAAKKTINFVDYGQDFLQLVIDQHGEILNCNAHGNLYNSKFVDMDRLSVGSPIWIQVPSKDESQNENMEFKPMGRLIVESINDYVKSKTTN